MLSDSPPRANDDDVPSPAGLDRTPDLHRAAPRAPRVQTQFSGGFGEWLIRHRVGLVCSTYQTGHLIFIGARAGGRAVPSSAGFSRAMGIAAFNQRIYVGTKNQIWRLENILEPNEIESGMFDRLYVPRNAQVTGDVHIHELGVEPTGRMIFVNTRYSCLATVSATHSFKPLWKPKFISKIAPEDRCHLNGLAMEDGRVRYVSACSASDSVESWRSCREGGGVLIDVENDEIIVEGLSMPHSPRVLGDAIYLLDSARGALVRVERASGRREDVAFCPGFARGLAFVDHYALVTISLPRVSAFDTLPVVVEMKARGASAWSGLLVIDLRNGDIVHWLRFEGDVTELFDVAVIPEVRCPRGIGPETTEMAELTRWH